MKTNKTAFIGEKPFTDSAEFSKFYERGAKAVNSKVRVSVNWFGDFTDPKKATKIANSAI